MVDMAYHKYATGVNCFIWDCFKMALLLLILTYSFISRIASLDFEGLATWVNLNCDAFQWTCRSYKMPGDFEWNPWTIRTFSANHWKPRVVIVPIFVTGSIAVCHNDMRRWHGCTIVDKVCTMTTLSSQLMFVIILWDIVGNIFILSPSVWWCINVIGIAMLPGQAFWK